MIIFYACKSNLLVEAIRNRSWNEIIEICESQSEHSHSAQMAKQWCRIKLTGEKSACVIMLPLHYIVIMADGSKESLQAVEAVAKLHPHALECKESSLARTPLHLACLHEDYMLGIGGCNHLILFLLHAYPDAAMERDRLLRTPLHYAAANDANVGERALHELLESYPEATTARDGQGWLPLHVACHYKSNFRTIQALNAVNPDAVVAMTPLDLETPYELVQKQSDIGFKDKYEILDFLAEKAKYYVPTPTPFMDSFVSDNFIHPIY
ncbi:hypothetical protein MHU86_12961 [Fragilaria crotonensis]|nr:hypothetical protein MHU86_12961 [Fragilaria crotonensis]